MYPYRLYPDLRMMPYTSDRCRVAVIQRSPGKDLGQVGFRFLLPRRNVEVTLPPILVMNCEGITV
jgi:hypothetical protein